ncbi:MAG: cytochrome c-type biogenesis protein [Wenzhouxiangella sp.]
MRSVLAFVFALCLAPAALGSAIEPYDFDNELQEKRFRELAGELRCTVCQNQSLADSDAPLAQDLRDQLFEMLQQGRSDTEIRQYMVDRYGDYVLYRPPVAGHTMLLWGGPLLLLAIGLTAGIIIVRKRKKALA